MTTNESDNIWGTPETDDINEEEPHGRHARKEEPADTDQLHRRIQELTEELAEARADLKNHQDRKRRDLDSSYEAGRGEVISNIIPVLDSIAGAQEHGDLTDDNPLTAILKTLTQTLEGLGLGAIGDVGDDFDPNAHEAMHVETKEGAEGTKISKVHQRGYATTERLLRPALVTVVKKP